MHSIKSHLSLGLLLSLVVIFVAQWLLVSHAVRVLAEDYTGERLMHDAEGLLRSVTIDPHSHFSLDHASINPIFRRPFSGHYYHINIDGKIHRSRSLWDQELKIPNTPTSTIMQTL